MTNVGFEEGEEVWIKAIVYKSNSEQSLVTIEKTLHEPGWVPYTMNIKNSEIRKMDA